jgi:sodium transport system permease protein
MSPLAAVFRKELIDTLRDRRTLVAMILVPMLLFPVLMIGMTRYTQSRAAEARTKTLHVAVVDPLGGSGVAAHLAAAPGVAVEDARDISQLPARIQADELDAAVVVAPTFAADLAAHRPGTVTLMFKSSDDFDIEKKRLEGDLRALEQEILAARFAALGLDPGVVRGIDLREHDVASVRERLGKLVGGLLPYMFIIFCFTGSMYPAIDLGAGEKERGTLETLLTAPVHRRTLVLGKFAVVSLWLSFSQGIQGVPAEALGVIAQIFEPATIAVVIALLVPLSMFFAALLLMLSVYARSYKEAMSVISPLMIVVFLPAVVAMLPGTRLTAVTAAIPVLNVSLATRELLAGTAAPALVALVFASLVVFAAASLYACARWFAREDIVFRA